MKDLAGRAWAIHIRQLAAAGRATSRDAGDEPQHTHDLAGPVGDGQHVKTEVHSRLVIVVGLLDVVKLFVVPVCGQKWMVPHENERNAEDAQDDKEGGNRDCQA